LMLNENRVHRPWCYTEARSLQMLLRGPFFTFSEKCSIEWEYRKLIHWDRSSHSPRDVRASGSIGIWTFAIEVKTTDKFWLAKLWDTIVSFERRNATFLFHRKM
jgi:hypothetical protein